MSNLIVGGLITLAGSAVVQVVVVPWVTTRRRHRERWEDSVIELLSVLEVELPIALRQLRRPAIGLQQVNQRLADTDTWDAHRPPLDALKSQYTAEAAEMNDRLNDLRAHAFRLTERVMLYNKSATFWPEFALKLFELEASLMSLDSDSASFDQQWNEAHDRRAELVKKIKVVSQGMRPPRPRPLRRVTRPLRRREPDRPELPHP